MSEEATTTDMNQAKKNAFMAWIDARLPVTEAIERHLTKYYAPKNFNFWYVFGVLAMSHANLEQLVANKLSASLPCFCTKSFVEQLGEK